MHHRHLTIEQRQSLTNLIRSRLVPGAQLEIGLDRLHQPDYGVCIDCGRDIGFVRLKLDPWTLHCQACALLPVASSEQEEALA